LSLLHYDKKLEISTKVILHWTENLFLAYAHELNCDDITEDKCEFCQQFLGCKKCPISLFYLNCGENLSLYQNVFNSVNMSYADYGDKFFSKTIINVSAFLEKLEYVCDEWLKND
jgi:hypothetical protein